MTRHLTHRRCGKGSGLTWTRFPTDDGSAVTYRLHRRDHRNAMHAVVLNFFATHPRAFIAERLNRARHQLRDKVDEIDLAALFEQENAA